MRIFKVIIILLLFAMGQPMMEVKAIERTKEVEMEIQSKDDTMIESLEEFLSKKIEIDRAEIIEMKTLGNSKIKIIDKKLTWNGELDFTNKPKKIVMHHIEASRTSSNIGVEEVHQWHKNNGWAGIGYHFYINKKGEIYSGRPENAIGAHALNHNIDTLGIAVEGKYETETMPNIQKEAIELLGKYLRQKYEIETINKHQDLVPTSCPGKNYPFVSVKNSILQEKLLENGIYEVSKENNRIFLLDTWRNIHGEGQVKYKNKIYNVSSTKGILNTGFLILDNDKYYMKNDNTYAIGWLKIEDKWYYFGDNGVMKSNWNFIDKDWYYLDSNGVMKTGWINDSGWYYMNKDGKMEKGWFFDDDWYYSDVNTGKMQIGWLYDNSKWYYLKNSGNMAKEWNWINNKWYYFDHSGEMQSGWIYDNSNWYYLNGSGDMSTGWICEDHKWYYFDYSGIMKTGWQWIDNNWYYLKANGEMATNTTIDGWNIGYDGIATKIA